MVSYNLDLCPSKIKHRDLLKHAEEMVDLYINQNMTLREIGNKFGCEKSAVGRILRKNGIKILVCIDCNNEFRGRKGVCH
jgi:DNA invertase Pin-like site-specific DNA recombinase